MTELICVGCPRGCHLKVDEENDYEVTGYSCNIGLEYGKNELRNPTRTLTSTVKLVGGIHKLLPVRTNKPISKGLLFEVMKVLKTMEVTSPVKMGDVVVANILNSGVDIIASRDM